MNLALDAGSFTSLHGATRQAKSLQALKKAGLLLRCGPQMIKKSVQVRKIVGVNEHSASQQRSGALGHSKCKLHSLILARSEIADV
eukprot:5748305-Amphidinium_carterae.1